MSKNIEDQTENIKRSLAYWKRQLAGLPPMLELPVKQQRSSSVANKKARLTFSISGVCADALSELSRQLETDMFVTLLASYKTLLYRYTNQEDISAAYPVMCQNISDSGKLQNNLLNVLMLRTDMSGEPSFCELVMRVRDVIAGACANADLPLEILVDALKPESALAPESLFQVMFTFQGGIDCEIGTSFLQGRETVDAISPACDLNLILEDMPDGIAGTWEYNANLFDGDTIERMAEHYTILLESIVANSSQPISCLPLLSTKERNRLVVEWNDTHTDYPDNNCIHELFEIQARANPNAVAVIYRNEKLTYSELNARANQLAHYLRKNGVQEETLVPICIERSLEMIVGILGILKSGGAYVPIDPEYPLERIEYMLKDSNAAILLSTKKSLGSLKTHDLRVIDIQDDWNIIRREPTANPLKITGSFNLAYVIYTSGSTGRPKGVMIEHRNVCSFIRWCEQEFSLSTFRIVYASTSICFDLSVFEIFYPLSVCKPFRIIQNGLEIGNYLAKDSEVLINTVPSILQSLLRERSDLANVSVINMAGEPIPLLVQQSLDADKKEIRNLYGPSEDTTYSTAFRIRKGSPVFIGRPISNTKIYIVDNKNQLCPIGVSGEIFIGGSGLSRGYLNRPELTAEKFIRNPFSDDVKERVYKTGDLGRYTIDGNIIFLGRKDQQVKIRGYRIELGEIELTLSRFPSVKQVVVLAMEDQEGDKRLVAYLELSLEQKPSTSDLRLFIREKLPEYMVPSLFMFLKTFPLTPNGKVDRSALPAPDLQRPALEKTYLAPRNNLERKLAKIFEECLRIQPIGVRDNFFDLGTHSIQAAHIFSRIKNNLGKQLHLSILLQAPTIEQLAVIINAKNKTAPWSALVPMQPNGYKPPLFCIHGGIGTVLFYRDLASSLGSDQPFYGLQAKGLNGIGTPHTCIEDMASYYIDEIKKLQPEGPYYLGGYCFGGIVAYEMAKQLTSQGQEIALLANFNAVSPTYVEPPDAVGEINAMNDEDMANTISDKQLPVNKKNEKAGALISLVFLFKALTRKVRNRLQYTMKFWIYKYCFTYGRPLPEQLAKFYLWEMNSAMVRAYRPQPYQGRMVIFRSPAIYPDPHLGWSQLVTGSIETCDIPGAHENRRHILVEPFAQTLAIALKKYLAVESPKVSGQQELF